MPENTFSLDETIYECEMNKVRNKYYKIMVGLDVPASSSFSELLSNLSSNPGIILTMSSLLEFLCIYRVTNTTAVTSAIMKAIPAKKKDQPYS